MNGMPSQPLISIDAVPLIVHEGSLKVLTSVRQFAPHAGVAALPGVLLEANERLASAVNRALSTKAGVTQTLEPTQVAVFDDFERDERGPTLSIAHLVVLLSLPEDPRIVLHRIDQLPELPFDHNSIVRRAAGALLDALWVDATLTRRLLGERFTTASVIARMRELAAASGRPEPVTNNVSRALSSNPLLQKSAPVASGAGRPPATWTWTHAQQDF